MTVVGAVMALLSIGALEVTFLIVVGGVTALAGLFGLYVLIQMFRNPSRR